ncbi:MAG: GNAT family N-acetyltransferase [Deltaproteobacteria bacterium]|nr:GNAT family N-acetyltransferase [Deltaproteobacteria bacterium]
MDWRYLGGTVEQESLLFWARRAGGEPIGVAGLAFRPYWVDGRQEALGVLGDISVDSEYRGQGLAARLFRFVNEHVRERVGRNCFVIPNDAARRSLEAAGWTTALRFVPQVLVLRPETYLRRFAGERAGQVLGRLARTAQRLAIGRPDLRGGYEATWVGRIGDALGVCWDRFPKGGLVVRDRSAAALRWRYEAAPVGRCQVASVTRRGAPVGYFVCALDEAAGSCSVSDLLFDEIEDVAPGAAALRRLLLRNSALSSVRIRLGEGHPYAAVLARAGFVRRRPDGVLQTFFPQPWHRQVSWFVTAGDKDA